MSEFSSPVRLLGLSNFNIKYCKNKLFTRPYYVHELDFLGQVAFSDLSNTLG